MNLKQLIEESRFEIALAQLRAALSRTDPTPDQERLTEILTQLARGLCDWDSLQWGLERLLCLRPTHMETAVRLTHAWARTGEVTKAMDLAQRLAAVAAAAGQPREAAQRLYERAALLAGLDMPDEALEALEQALAHAPHHGPAALLSALLAADLTASLRVVQRLADPHAHGELVAGTAWRPPPEWIGGGFGAQCLMHHDESLIRHPVDFVVADGQGRALLRVEAFVTENGVTGPFGPIQVVPSATALPGEKAYGLALDHLEALCRAFGGQPAVADHPGGFASPLGAMMFKRGYRPRMRITMDIDLTLPEERLWQGVRASNRPYIRKGQAELAVRTVNAGNPDWDLLDQARLLHYRYDGTPLEKIFYVLPVWRRFLAAGQGEFTVVFDGDEAVAAILVIDEGGNGVYTFSRYARDTRIRVGPFALWHAICRARSRGLRRFHLGVAEDMDFDGGKRRNIADFKSGFTSDYRYDVAWEICLR